MATRKIPSEAQALKTLLLCIIAATITTLRIANAGTIASGSRALNSGESAAFNDRRLNGGHKHVHASACSSRIISERKHTFHNQKIDEKGGGGGGQEYRFWCHPE